MITMAIGLAAGVFYWLTWYKLAFWILIYAIIYGGLGVLRGDNQRHALLRRDSALNDCRAHSSRLACRRVGGLLVTAS